jgi:hypothetical protein
VRTSLYRLFGEHAWVGDGIFAGPLTVILIVNCAAFHHTEPTAIPLLIASGGPLFIRRSSPRVALVTGVVLLTLTVALIDRPTFTVVLAPILAHAAVAYVPDRSGVALPGHRSW